MPHSAVLFRKQIVFEFLFFFFAAIPNVIIARTLENIIIDITIKAKQLMLYSAMAL